MGSFTANSVALQVPEIALLQLPFFFDSQQQRDCVLDNHVQKHTVEALAKKNLVFIGWGEVGSVHLPGKKAYADAGRRQGPEGGRGRQQDDGRLLARDGRQPDPHQRRRGQLVVADRADRHLSHALCVLRAVRA